MTDEANESHPDEDVEPQLGGEHELGGPIILLLGVALISLVVYAASTVGLNIFEQRGTFIMLILLYVFARFPLVETIDREVGSRTKWALYALDAGIVITTLASYGYLIINSEDVMTRVGLVESPEPLLALGAVLVVLEATRRTIGNVIPILVVVSFGYVFFGGLLPGLFSHPGFSTSQVTSHQFLTARGIFSFPLKVSLDYIYLFIFFGATLEVCGGGDAFLDLAKVLVGKLRGGPAKLAVVSSGFMGMLSGSTTANTLTTGAFTIPTMKEHGYDSEFAGGVEAAASTGGPLTPPVMGATIFIMIELTGLSYLYIIKHSLLPALLFFFGIMLAVHFRALKDDLKTIPPELIPPKAEVIKNLWYFLPVVAIVILLYLQFSVQRAILMATGLLLLMTYGSDLIGLSDRIRMYDPRIHNLSTSPIIETIDMTAKRAAPVIAAATAIGILIGNFGLTGLGIKVSALVTSVGEGNLLLALLLAAGLCILFGVTMTSITVYILVAILVVPGLIELGLIPFQAHMFALYYGMLAMVTPPVCLAAYAASTIAESDPIKTGVKASLISLPAYLIPFSFAYDPALLLIGSPMHIATATLTAMIGIVALGAGIIGHLTEDLHYAERAVLIVGAVALINAAFLTDIVGLGLLLVGSFRQLDNIYRGVISWQRQSVLGQIRR